MSEKSNLEQESLSDQLADLTKRFNIREATSRFLIDSAKETERRALADAKISEAKEYAWRDKSDRQGLLLRECLASVEFNISVHSSMLICGTLNEKDAHDAKIKRSQLEALKENIENELRGEHGRLLSISHSGDSGAGGDSGLSKQGNPQEGADSNLLHARDSENRRGKTESDERVQSAENSDGESEV